MPLITIVFAEHRYYGVSMPFGNKSYDSPAYMGYLTSQQALADYAHLLQNKLNPNGRPVVVFGGSYGGLLAGWMRMKYPHLVDGAIASAAPYLQFEGGCNNFIETITAVYEDAGHNCAENIRKSWTYLG